MATLHFNYFCTWEQAQTYYKQLQDNYKQVIITYNNFTIFSNKASIGFTCIK